MRESSISISVHIVCSLHRPPDDLKVGNPESPSLLKHLEHSHSGDHDGTRQQQGPAAADMFDEDKHSS
uniref:Uncharacterized protein n=1 Tax=Oryza punctata TaxID=4537 RepID=A0A0E0MLP2_ORYPU